MEPNGYIVVGETDWLGQTPRSVDMLHDSRLRACRNIASAVWRTSYSARIYRPSPVHYYCGCELRSGSPTTVMLGLAQESLISVSSWVANNANGAAIRLINGGNIYLNAGIVQTGLGNGLVGDVVGMEWWADESAIHVQFHKNGDPFGAPVSLALAATFRIGISLGDTASEARFLCDAVELRSLPAGCQPWGAAAHVAAGGGDSPAATLLNRARVSTSTIVSDAFLRTVTPVADTNWRTIAAAPAAALSTTRRLRYFEVLIEVVGSSTHAGLGLVADPAVDVYAGQTDNSWGLSVTGSTWHSGAPNSAGAVAWNTAGKRAGVLWDCVGGVWFFVDGVLVGGGDPVAGTGARYSNVTGAVEPLVSQLGPTIGRARLCTHAREQLYRPSYAQAWDGADILPEQPYEDCIAAVPKVIRAVSYFPWADQRERGRTIGQLDLANADGRYDRLSHWDLRNQPIVAYSRRADGTLEREWTGLIDSVDHPEPGICRISVSDAAAALEQRVDRDVLVIGNVAYAPAVAVRDSDLTYEIADRALIVFDQLLDGGEPVDTWRRVATASADPDASPARIRRSANPARLHAVTNLRACYRLANLTATNLTLNAWTGSTPNGWTKSESGTGTVTGVSGNTAARLQGGTGYSAIHHSGPFTLTEIGSNPAPPDTDNKFDSNWIFVALHITTNNAQDLDVVLEDFAGAFKITSDWRATRARITGSGTGWFFVPIRGGDVYGTFSLYTVGAADITVDEVRLYGCDEITSVAQVVAALRGEPFAAAYDLMLKLTSPNQGLGFGLLRPSNGLYGLGQPGAGLGYLSKQRPTIRALLDVECARYFADYYTDAVGDVRFTYLTEPEAVLDTDEFYLGAIVEEDLWGDLRVRSDDAPRLTDSGTVNHNFAEHSDTDMVGAVSASTRRLLQSPHQDNRLDVPGAGAGHAKRLAPHYSFAVGAPPVQRFMRGTVTASADPTTANADRQLIRLHRAYAQKRRFFEFEVSRLRAEELADTLRRRTGRQLGLVPGPVIDLRHSRYGLAAGRRVQIVSLEFGLTEPTVAVVCWG